MPDSRAFLVNSVDPQLTGIVRALANRPDHPGRTIIGISGSPGSGKSTLATAVVAALGPGAAYLPMDGYHLADVELTRQGLRDRKGAPETFDAYGYARLLRDIRADEPHPLYAPNFERTIEQPLAGAIAILPEHRIVVTEGNYLLVDAPQWRAVRGQLDEAWHVLADPTTRAQRLVARHVLFGKTPEAAAAWIASVDDPNAVLIESQRERADRILDLSHWTIDPAG